MHIYKNLLMFYDIISFKNIVMEIDDHSDTQNYTNKHIF